MSGVVWTYNVPQTREILVVKIFLRSLAGMKIKHMKYVCITNGGVVCTNYLTLSQELVLTCNIRYTIGY